ncbi:MULTISPECIES: DUF4123 domain-containing protein [Pseudomonas]|uniref:DUF4123 domain-containing protein n=1 Tax=Pseudomonas TaxID=286 RepID=UPI001E6407CC|nr:MULTISPECIES: DUF4123 domain-containing protein [Pseudomonas]MCE1117954.1 DUF4123 domain-containing protein [Pseudomonas sp. NMI795_08]
MIAPHIAQWLALLEHGCASGDDRYLHILLDQAASHRPWRPSVMSVEPPLAWCSLFDGLPEAAARDLAPLLVRVDLAQPLQRHWLQGVLQATDGQAQLLALRSHWPFEALARHLGRCLEARLGGVTGLLRYYDPRLFPLLFSHVLHPEQQQHWLRPAVFWSWLDRDGQGQRLAGTDDIPGPLERFEPIELSDHQVDILGCASDVTLGMDAFTAACPADWGAERRFQASYSAMLAASQAGVWRDDERQAYTLERLRDA